MNAKVQPSLPITYSDKFRETLNKITHEISDFLLEKENHMHSIYSYIDIGNSSDTVSFIQANKAIDMKANMTNWEELVWTSKRGNMKIGKFLMSLVGDRFQLNSNRSSAKLKSNDIESFVNKFKIEFSFDDYIKNFQIVEGEDIVKWYDENNYSNQATTSTTLGNSCMRYSKYSKYIKLYADNSEKVKMLIYKDVDGRLAGRALLWYLDEPINTIFMDRIYSTEDKIIDLYKKYASMNKWLHKSYQTYGYEHDLVDTNVLPHQLIKQNISVKLKDQFYRFIPYLDTLQVLDKETNILSNKGELIGKNPYIHCVGYNGYSVIDRDAMDNHREFRDSDDENDVDPDEYVYSNYHGREISRHDARWCEFGQDWIRSGDAVYVFNSGQRYAVPGNSDIIYSDFSDKWFARDRVVYSDFYSSYIYHDSAIAVFKDVDRNETAVLHKNDHNKYFEYKGYYYLNSIKEQVYSQNNEVMKSSGIDDLFSPRPTRNSRLTDRPARHRDLLGELEHPDRHRIQFDGEAQSEPTVRRTEDNSFYSEPTPMDPRQVEPRMSSLLVELLSTSNDRESNSTRNIDYGELYRHYRLGNVGTLPSSIYYNYGLDSVNESTTNDEQSDSPVESSSTQTNEDEQINLTFNVEDFINNSLSNIDNRSTDVRPTDGNLEF